MWEGISTGFATALTLANIGWVLVGCLAGTVIGMLPGLGPITAIALMIPVSYSLDPAGGLIMMAGVYYGAVFGGSTSAILINAPGVASTVATSFDGYPMARAGQAGRALAIAAYASFAGGTLGALALMIFAGYLAALALEFQSPEYSLLLLIAMTSVVIFADRGARVRSLVTLLIGLMLGTIGTDQLAGIPRFTLGRYDLADGLNFVLVVMATFALAEAVRMVLLGESVPMSRVTPRELVLPRSLARPLAPVVGRSALVGFLTGVLPGAGATLASFFAWDLEKRVGDGSREAGVAAPEAANNAASTGSFVPLLTLGIPGSGTTAVLLGVMLSYGLQPGPRLLTEQPDIFWGVIASMYLGNLFLLALNLPLIPVLARLLNLSSSLLIPLIVAFSLVGVYLTTLNGFDLYLMLGLALLALLLRWFDFPLAPLLLGFILSGLFEENVRRTLFIGEGGFAELLLRPAVVILLVLLLALVLVPLVRRRSESDR
ncbi:MAG: tripartite tricarboxylate transporter permease [Pseudomonadales bacterium]